MVQIVNSTLGTNIELILKMDFDETWYIVEMKLTVVLVTSKSVGSSLGPKLVTLK